MVLLSESPASPVDIPALLRTRASPILERAGLWDPRARLWSPSDLGRFTTGLGLGRRTTVVDLGCGWGALGALLALQVPGLRVVGVDLDEELLEVGRGVVAALGLERRVQLRRDDLEGLDPREIRGASVVVAQAVLAHLPRAAAWLGELVSRCPSGMALGFVERDRGRDELAMAVAGGARATLGVERGAGGALARWMEGVGLAGIGTAALVQDWTRESLERRLRDGLDPVDHGLARAGGATAEQLRDWSARREEDDQRRLAALRQGRPTPDRPDGWTMAWGVVP